MARAVKKWKGELIAGHKGEAVLVPFDPAKEWGQALSPVPAPWKTGHLVHASVNGIAYDGWIGSRWGRRFMIVPESLMKAEGLATGDVVSVEVRPRAAEIAPPTKPARNPTGRRPPRT